MKYSVEDQRKADLGDSNYLNPVLPGDHADPSVLKDGDVYYMTHSSFHSYPGLLVWHSKDLVNWEPVGPALRKNVGSVWAPDLSKHNGRYYIYFPGVTTERTTNYVVWADNINGPWSDPIDLNIGEIDPGHVVGPDGKRYLFMSRGYMVPLADDGLSAVGKMNKVYDGWKYPEDWVVESFSQEGPKMLQHGDYYHMVLAEGGTAGPPTSHMVISARAKHLEGPWENSPYNPIVRTNGREEKWWSKGHATLVEGPGGKWYLVYHAYENGFYTLGRQTLLEPVVWTDDGWFKSAGCDVSNPIPKPTAPAMPNPVPLYDDFSTNKIGVEWTFHNPGNHYADRYQYENGSLVLKGQGTSPKDSSPLCCIAGDHAYQVEVEIEIGEGARAGLIIFYNERLYAGLGFDHAHVIVHCHGTDKPESRPDGFGARMYLRLHNDRNVLTIFYSLGGQKWARFPLGMEVSGYHHNVAGGFLSLRPAIYATGNGEVKFRNFKYRALP